MMRVFMFLQWLIEDWSLWGNRPGATPGRGAKLGSNGIELEAVIAPAFAVSPPDSRGVVQVTGSVDPDTVNITVNSSQVVIDRSTLSASTVKGLVVNGLGGDDKIYLTYGSGAYNPAITLRGGGNSDKVEIWNAAGKNV